MKRLLGSAVLVLALTVTASATAHALSGLKGTYAAKITGAPSPQLNGTWALKFSGSGYTILLNGHAVISGSLSYEQGSILFTDKSGPLACKPKGSYRYILGGKTLRFTVYTDTCPGRKFVLVGHKFTKTA